MYTSAVTELGFVFSRSRRKPANPCGIRTTLSRTIDTIAIMLFGSPETPPAHDVEGLASVVAASLGLADAAVGDLLRHGSDAAEEPVLTLELPGPWSDAEVLAVADPVGEHAAGLVVVKGLADDDVVVEGERIVPGDPWSWSRP